MVESDCQTNTTSLKQVEKKMEKVDLRNRELESENTLLKERLLDIEYRQRRNNLIFEGVVDSEGELEADSILKIRRVLRAIPGLDRSFKMDRCYRSDGRYKPSKTRRLLCVFNWYVDVQFILKHKKSLPKGIFVNEDLPEEWNDCRKILKLIFNVARRNSNLTTHMSKDKLVINGHTFSAAPNCNIQEANDLIDVKSTCEQSDDEKILFSGSLTL